MENGRGRFVSDAAQEFMHGDLQLGDDWLEITIARGGSQGTQLTDTVFNAAGRGHEGWRTSGLDKLP
jgi:hypothetical protein